jgi:hypothetical protein
MAVFLRRASNNNQYVVIPDIAMGSTGVLGVCLL